MKEYRISARVPEELKKRLEEVERELGIDQAIIVRKCIEALIEYVEERGEITFPLRVSPKSKPVEPNQLNYRQKSRSSALNEEKDSSKPSASSRKHPPEK